MSTHTPGPWRTSSDRDEVVIHAGKFDYLPACTKSGTLDEWQANARLIAAAPDLLAALKFCAVALDSHVDIERRTARDVIRAALAKAEGGAA